MWVIGEKHEVGGQFTLSRLYTCHGKPTTWSRVPLGKLAVFASQEIPRIYCIIKFDIVSTTAHSLNVFSAKRIQFTSHPVFWRSILILSCHLRLGVQSFFAEILYLHLPSQYQVTGTNHAALRYTIFSSAPHPITSTLTGPDIGLPLAPYSQTSSAFVLFTLYRRNAIWFILYKESFRTAL
jgi:hypothetical protein